MALNKYTTSSRFTDTTSNDEGNGSTAKERNAAKYKEYQARVSERDRLIAAQEKEAGILKRKQGIYEREIADEEGPYNPAARRQGFIDEGMVKVSDDRLLEMNIRAAKEGSPEMSEMYRPAVNEYNNKKYKTDDEYFKDLYDRTSERSDVVSYGPVYRTDFKYNKKSYDEIPYPQLEDEPLERITPPSIGIKTPSIIGRKPVGKYVEPEGPGGVRYVKGKRSEKIGTAKQRRQIAADRLFGGGGLKAGKTEGQKGYFKNLGERRKFRREGELAKASFGRGFNEMDSVERAEREKDLRQDRRSFIGAAFRRPGQGGLAAARETGREIRDLKKAEKYSERNLGFGPEIKSYTPNVMKNYRSSEDNPLNRNRRSS
jgi:hypothetical protein